MLPAIEHVIVNRGAIDELETWVMLLDGSYVPDRERDREVADIVHHECVLPGYERKQMPLMERWGENGVVEYITDRDLKWSFGDVDDHLRAHLADKQLFVSWAATYFYESELLVSLHYLGGERDVNEFGLSWTNNKVLQLNW